MRTKLLYFLPLLAVCVAVFVANPAFSGKYDSLPVLREAGDFNGNGINDVDDIIAGARAEVSRRPWYKSGYYQGGYPPADEGVCTDLVWRAFKEAGYDLKSMIDADIKANPGAYPRVAGKPDRNIDFRRVPNQSVFFARHAKKLSPTIIADNPEDLALWQSGDIVVFRNPDHIAILSTKRNAQGVPYLIHNDGPWPCEADDFEKWRRRGLVAHYRWVK